MNTPICTFVKNYVNRDPLRLHMPGHKGVGPLGVEPLDITEIAGADVLYHAGGVIRESEDNAAALFGAHRTLYSAEGSSLCVRAMLYLALLYAKSQGRTPRIAAGRNAHRSFLSAAALLDLPVDWLWPAQGEGLLSCSVDPDALCKLLEKPDGPTAVYITTPDYLGNLQNLRQIGRICTQKGALLLVDNAHGAYLSFLTNSLHPMALGADLCCDSAHKTLPALTGGAYLHIGKPRSPGAQGKADFLAAHAEGAMALFASTSPSYLILQSLDALNPLLEKEFPKKLHSFLKQLFLEKQSLLAQGWELVGDEPMKLTIAPKSYGYKGSELAALLAGEGITAEFADPDYLVLMPSPSLGPQGLHPLTAALAALPRRSPIPDRPPAPPRPRRVLSPREALLAPREEVPLAQALGRVLADPAVSCPPAVPILVCGEEIDPAALHCFQYYGIETCSVVKP